jgi:hypothetical protein
MARLFPLGCPGRVGRHAQGLRFFRLITGRRLFGHTGGDTEQEQL